jgi:hypothetical protein
VVSRPWTRADYTRDASDLRGQAADDAVGEGLPWTCPRCESDDWQGEPRAELGCTGCGYRREA